MTGFSFPQAHGTNARLAAGRNAFGDIETPMAGPVPYFPDLSAIADRFDGFVLDLWGVIHDGVSLYPEVVDALARLDQAGKAFVMLSNAPRRAQAVAASMISMGMPNRFCGHVFSSGEATWRALSGSGVSHGRRCLHIGPSRDLNLLDGLDVDQTSDIGHADFILNTGPWGDDEQVSDYEDLMRSGAGRGVHMICANPDLEVIRGGQRIICAGALAQRYEALGGDVTYFGKPHPEIYGQCFEILEITDRSRILAIGDSLRTDIAGAAAAGIASALVTSGIHGEQIGTTTDGTPDPEGLARFCAEAAHPPDMVLPAFVWNDRAGETLSS